LCASVALLCRITASRPLRPTPRISCRSFHSMISRKDYLTAIEKYIANLPEHLRPEPAEASGSEDAGDESSSVSVPVEDPNTGSDDDDDNLSAGDDASVHSTAATDEKPPAGFAHKTLTHGDATNYPIDGDTCQIHYEGRIPPPRGEDGKLPKADAAPVIFDSTYLRKETVHIQLGRGDVIKGIEYALRYMSVGQKSSVVIPPEWAYGAVGYPPLIEPDQTLMYEVELLRFSNDADARAGTNRPPNPVPIGMEQFTKGAFDMDDVTMQAESSYYQAINEHL
jgi:FKBP-type peptidyl-prolyl cis-trans isomerase